ncbi:MAG: hypothetical protein IPM13_10550 [Phycisphaerales bacterium]|nr:hypothetical protein [Phycisphaerales bacterium]
MALILQDRRRIPIGSRAEIRVRRARGTIEVNVRGDAQEIAFGELLAIELRPRAKPTEPRM